MTYIQFTIWLAISAIFGVVFSELKITDSVIENQKTILYMVGACFMMIGLKDLFKGD